MVALPCVRMLLLRTLSLPLARSFQDSPSLSALANSWTTDRTATSQLCYCSSVFSSSPYSYYQNPPVHGQSLRLQGTAAGSRRMVVAGAEARVRSTEQTWRNQSTVLNCPLGSSSGFFQPARHIETKRFCCMASGGSKQGGGFAPSCALKETTTPQDDLGGKGDILSLVTFETKDGQSVVGVVRGGVVWSLQDALDWTGVEPLPHSSDMTSVITNWNDLKDRLIMEGGGTTLTEVKLLAPIPRPTGVIMCIGKNYLDHVQEVDTWKSAPGLSAPDAPKHPIVFTKAPQSVIGPEAAIKYPHGVSSAVDYEAELAVIIGKAGQNIKREDAMSHIFGYTIINDVTARDLQKRHQQWFLGKSCDTFCPMGPGIVPASEIDGNNLHIQCWINDELRQDGRTSQMIFGIPQLIEVISAATTLQPGDIIATGTPAGVGSGFNPPRHLAPGDKVRIRIEGIGELNNTVE